MQISAKDPAPVLEERLLSACSAGLKRARCVAAARLQQAEAGEPSAVAVVSWEDPAHVTIEVGLGTEQPVWLQRELGFTERDPEFERWRAAGFTVALLVDDPRFWAQSAPASEPLDVAPPLTPAPQPAARVVELDLRALSGAGLVSGAWRAGAELRASVALSEAFFATGAVEYALASQSNVDVRWFDAALGMGWYVPSFWSPLQSRLRLELLAENLAASAQQAASTDRRNVWVPGLALGGDLIWPLAAGWGLSARIDGFWLDGSSVITDAGERAAVSAGAGILLGLGAGVQF
ncbi:MAG TPA: hypothetical protein VFS67_26200 [Polyangiaceae bacterium]|nr:hypothetical protein [Polyangiaceae bacterium]